MLMKLKTRKAALKRVKPKKNCFSRRKANKSHLLKSKNSKRLRNLSRPAIINPSDKKSF